MDTHQKISIGIFGTLLIGTMAMYSTGSLSSSAINLNTGSDTIDCTEKYIKDHAETYASDTAKMIELQKFVGRNCGGDVLESKKSYCDARTKQIETYANLVKKYEGCLKTFSDSIPAEKTL